MATKRRGWMPYKVEYDNGECRYYDHESTALSHARRMAKSMAVVCVTWDGKLLARWKNGRVTNYYDRVIPIL